MRDSVAEWMAFCSHRWQFITPAALGDAELLPMHWWVYYVRAAQAYVDAQERAVDAMKTGRHRG